MQSTVSGEPAEPLADPDHVAGLRLDRIPDAERLPDQHMSNGMRIDTAVGEVA
jgi:hypothetical protein